MVPNVIGEIPLLDFSGRWASFPNIQAPGYDVKKIEKEFLDNSRCCRKRTNGVVLYHEVLAFSGKDREYISADILTDLASKFLELRARGAMAYGVIHFEHENPHVHFVISGNLMSDSKKLRLSKGEFHQVKRKLEKYQRERYPELENSVVFQRGNIGKNKTTRQEQERSRRLKSESRKFPSRKEAAKEKLVYCLLAHTQNEFRKRIHVCDFNWYARGKTVGVQDLETGRKYRLKTLGLLEQYQETLSRWKESEVRKKEIYEMEQSKVLRCWQELGFKEQISEVLCQDDNTDKPKVQRQRIKELKQIARNKRQQRRDKGLEL